MEQQTREALLREIGKCLTMAHEAEKQDRLDEAKRYAAAGQKLLDQLHKLSSKSL